MGTKAWRSIAITKQSSAGLKRLAKENGVYTYQIIDGIVQLLDTGRKQVWSSKPFYIDKIASEVDPELRVARDAKGKVIRTSLRVRQETRNKLVSWSKVAGFYLHVFTDAAITVLLADKTYLDAVLRDTLDEKEVEKHFQDWASTLTVSVKMKLATASLNDIKNLLSEEDLI